MKKRTSRRKCFPGKNGMVNAVMRPGDCILENSSLNSIGICKKEEEHKSYCDCCLMTKGTKGKHYLLHIFPIQENQRSELALWCN